VQLDPEQYKAVELAAKGHNIFLTGVAGTGKSTITKQIIQTLMDRGKRVSIAGSTGVAAINIGGGTLHSLAGSGVPSGVKDFRRVWGGAAPKNDDDDENEGGAHDGTACASGSMMTFDASALPTQVLFGGTPAGNNTASGRPASVDPALAQRYPVGGLRGRGAPRNDKDEKKNESKASLRVKTWRKMDALVLDEVGMMKAEYLLRAILMHTPKGLNRDWSPRFSTLLDKNGWVRAKTTRRVSKLFL
jgi:hypothetical protein